MPKIISARGTSGSGKSTIVFTMFKNFPYVEVKCDGKVIGYDVDAGLNRPIHVVGKYTTACGGADGIQTQAEAAARCLTAYERGCHVIVEGLLASGAGPKGQLTIALQSTGNAIFAYLDTPLETCLARVQARRAARGDERPFNPKNTTDKFYQVVSTYKSMKRDGYPAILLDHTRPYEQIMEILRDSE